MTPSKNRGFTLIEILIVVVIVSILSAIAIPMYKDYVMRARIMEAVEGLSARQVQMEQCFQDQHKYTNTCAACPATSTSGKDFDFSCATADTTFTLTATGKGVMGGFTYTVTEGNVRGSTTGAGWGGSSTTCWITKKGESC